MILRKVERKMTKEVSDESVQDILDMWKNALEKAECVARYHIDEKVIDYDLIPGEVNCDECTSPFCFKNLQWLDDGQENSISSPKTLETIQITLTDTKEWEKAYV